MPGSQLAPVLNEKKLQVSENAGITTVFVDTRLWKTKHPRKRFQNFRQCYMYRQIGSKSTNHSLLA